MTREESLSIITEAIEDYVCNYVTDTAKAQKMLNAIQTLEQEPCNDAISRQGDDRWLLHFGQNMAIPSAEPKWIPVSERLPEEGIEVLVWYRYWRYGEYNNWYYTYGIGYQFDDYWSVIDGGIKTTVYAWQKLPEPYEPQKGANE